MAAKPEQPKRPMTGYWQWLTANRESIKKQCVTAKVSEVAKKGGEMWNKLSASERGPWEKKAADAKAQYEVQLATFKASGGVVTRKSKKRDLDSNKSKKDKDPNKPKKPPNPYLAYYTKNRASIAASLGEKAEKKDIAQKCSQMWTGLSAAEKKPYLDEFAKLKAAYDEKMKGYVPPAATEAAGGEEGENKDDDDEEAESDDDEEKEDQEDQEEEEEEEEEAPTKAISPKGTKRGRPAKTASPSGKRQKTGASPKPPKITATDKKEAGAHADALLKLAARQDIQEKGCSVGNMIKALNDNRGSLHPAKRALLGA